MTRSRIVLGAMLSAALICGGMAMARKPVENISGRKHLNLEEAQKLSREAFNKITEAQKANEWDMDGHAAKAKELLEEVNKELKQAAEAANKNHK